MRSVSLRKIFVNPVIPCSTASPAFCTKPLVGMSVPIFFFSIGSTKLLNTFISEGVRLLLIAACWICAILGWPRKMDEPDSLNNVAPILWRTRAAVNSKFLSSKVFSSSSIYVLRYFVLGSSGLSLMNFFTAWIPASSRSAVGDGPKSRFTCSKAPNWLFSSSFE